MGREVRKVPASWDHWKYSDQPLFDGFNEAVARWDLHNGFWQKGLYLDYDSKQWVPIPAKYKHQSFSEWYGDRPDPSNYMPDWDESERTHYQAYENTSEGTPISPVFATEDELIDWLVESKASAFGGSAGDRKFWTNVVKRDSGGLVAFSHA